MGQVSSSKILKTAYPNTYAYFLHEKLKLISIFGGHLFKPVIFNNKIKKKKKIKRAYLENFRVEIFYYQPQLCL